MYTEKEIHPLSLPRVAYLIWALCLVFSFYIGLVQFCIWENIGLGSQFNPYNITRILFLLPIALLLDKFGPKRMTSLIILLCGIGVLTLSFSTTHTQFWIGAFIMGFGGTVAIVNTPAQLTLLPLDSIKLALMIVPISSIIGVIIMFFIKETKAEQLTEEA